MELAKDAAMCTSGKRCCDLYCQPETGMETYTGVELDKVSVDLFVKIRIEVPGSGEVRFPLPLKYLAGNL